jgi:short-subunit dehydrogenase
MFAESKNRCDLVLIKLRCIFCIWLAKVLKAFLPASLLKTISVILNIFEEKEMKKISIISGGSSGLGLEISALLSARRKNILILGRNSEKLDKAVQRLENQTKKNSVCSLVCNIGNESDVLNVCSYLAENQYETEYLYNNAGIGLFAPADSSGSELIDKVFEANVKGMILLTSAILRVTPGEEELTIINIMSTSANIGRAEETIYCAAKFGARGFTEALRAELKGTKRNIIAVYPGGMKTDFWNAPGQNRNISGFMDPAMVAEKIVNAVLDSKGMMVSDITINRKS